MRAAAGKELTYRLPGGATMTTIVPPQGFRPQTAAPATARAYGFNAPNSRKALAAWRAKYQGYRETIPSVPCLGPSGKSSVRFSYSSNWSGYIATGHSNYNEVYDDQNIPTYSASCGSNASTLEAPWIGLGGYNSGKLIQQGFASGSSNTATQGASLWYEYLNSAHQNPPVYIGHTTKTGHVISQYMTYSSGKVGFHWYDRTAGSGWSPVTVSGLSGYYDGTTADYINERPYGFKLRKFSRQTFSAAGARYGSTFKDLFKLSTTEVRLTTNGASSGAALDTNTRSNSTAFYQTWKRCS
ncbi:G1 family glutamic endopeptidase [Streptomyces sp. NPDC058249]|uniref:G1 family glutamic endopeptidase n=1 Tax=Streptomyces sp. NPDC058249 TaxID=3346403 RepID=UPI0036E50B5A